MEFAENQQVLITRYDAFRFAGLHKPKNMQVFGIPACGRIDGARSKQDTVLAQQADNCPYFDFGQFDSFAKVLFDLRKQFLTGNDLMRVNAKLKDSFTQPASCKSSYDHVRIKQNPHEIALNTSSSVMKPCASANGSTLLRSDRNFAIATYRRMESRTMSLTGLF